MAKRSCDAGNANTTDASASTAALRPRLRSGSFRTASCAGANKGRSEGNRERSADAQGDHGARHRRPAGSSGRGGRHNAGSRGRPGRTPPAGTTRRRARAGGGAPPPRGPASGTASSHREAPLIAEDPSADLTDLYAFRSPDKPNTVTILANVIPGEDPAAGPNWYTFSPSARYNLKIDTDGDARTDVTYQFQFRPKTGPFSLGETAQPFTVTRIAGRSTKVVARGTTPPNNIGPRSTPNYRSLAAK